jgi:TolB protein
MKGLLLSALALSLLASPAFPQAREREEKKQESGRSREETKQKSDSRSRDDRRDRRDDDIIILSDPFPSWPGPFPWPGRGNNSTRLPRLTFLREGVGLCAMSENAQSAEVLRRNIEIGATSPARAPRRGRLAYVAPRDGQLALFTISDDLSRGHCLTNPKWGSADMPSWSPDDNALVFVSSRDGNEELYTISASGGTPRRLTNHPGRDTQPAWSPGGKWIVFVSERGGQPALWRIPSRGGEAVALEGCPPGVPSDPTFSPDGRFIVASFEEAPGKQHLWKIDLDAKEAPQRLTSEPGIYQNPTFRPDGSKLALSVRLASGGYALALLDFTSHGLQQLTPGTLSDRRPVWW